jgi:hypothetical protein
VPSGTRVPPSLLPSHVRLPGRLLPSPENVFTGPLAPTTCACHELTMSLLPKSRPKSRVLRPWAAFGENPLASAWIWLVCAASGFAVWHPARTSIAAAKINGKNIAGFLMSSSLK